MRRCSLALLGLLATTGVAAQDILPGMWELTLETRVDGAPGFAPEPYKLNQCFSAADARDPSRILGPLASPGASGCGYSEQRYVGATFRFTMECSGTLGLKTQGELSYSAERMSGSMTTSGNVLGQQTRFRSLISARRLGGC
jgi:hypothetical protein